MDWKTEKKWSQGKCVVSKHKNRTNQKRNTSMDSEQRLSKIIRHLYIENRKVKCGKQTVRRVGKKQTIVDNTHTQNKITVVKKSLNKELLKCKLITPRKNCVNQRLLKWIETCDNGRHDIEKYRWKIIGVCWSQEGKKTTKNPKCKKVYIGKNLEIAFMGRKGDFFIFIERLWKENRCIKKISVFLSIKPFRVTFMAEISLVLTNFTWNDWSEDIWKLFFYK